MKFPGQVSHPPKSFPKEWEEEKEADKCGRLMPSWLRRALRTGNPRLCPAPRFHKMTAEVVNAQIWKI